MRESVLWFAGIMEKKLQTKDADFPEGWKNDTVEGLKDRLVEETQELLEAISLAEIMTTPNEAIIVEAADVANFAMMIADKYRDHPQCR